MINFFRLFSMLLLLAQAEVALGQEKITFDDHAKPIFQKRCASCHNSERQSGGLDLTNFTNLMQGGSSGESIEPGDASGSYLYTLVTHEDSPEMPPSGSRIPDAEISKLEAWINGGALENKGSVAVKNKISVSTGSAAIGVRPKSVAMPLRLSLEPHFRTKTPGLIRSLATSPWGNLVAIAGPKQILLYQTKPLNYLGALPYPEGQANELTFSRNGSLLLAAGGRHGLAGKVVAYDVTQGTRVIDVGDEVDNVLAADIHPDQTLIALGGPQKMLRVYSTNDGSKIYEAKKHTDWVTAIQFSPDGVLLATADRNGGLQLWEAETGIEYLTLGGHDSQITDLSWRSDGNVLASCGDDGAIRLWEVENGRRIKNWIAHDNGASCLEFTRDGKIVSCGRDSLAKLWQQDGKLVRDFKGLKEIGVAVSFCDQSQRVIASDLSGAVAVWAAADGKLITSINTNPQTLERRLEIAKKNAAKAQLALKPIEKEFQQVQAEMKQLEETLSQQNTEVDAKSLQIKQLESQLATVNALRDSRQLEQADFKIELEEKKKQISVLAAAAQSAEKASQAIPNDSALKQSAETMAAKHAEYVTRIGELKKMVQNSVNNFDESEHEGSKIQADMQPIKELYQAAKKRVEALVVQQKPLLAKKQALVPSVAAARKELAKFEASVARWSEEIQFDALLNQRKRLLSAAEGKVQDRDKVLADAAKKLQAAQEQFDSRLKDHKESQQAVQEILNEIQILRSKK